MKRAHPDNSTSATGRVRYEPDQRDILRSTPMPPSLISGLPRELQEEILQWLAPRDLLRLGLTSKWYLKRCDAVYLNPRPREKFQCVSFEVQEGEVALSHLWRKFAPTSFDLLGRRISTVATETLFKTFQTVVVPRAARCVRTLWITASELGVHLEALPFEAGFNRIRIEIDPNPAWESVQNDLRILAERFPSVELIFPFEKTHAPGSIGVQGLGTALKALTFHHAQQIHALEGDLSSVKTLSLDKDFFERRDDLTAVMEWVKKRLPDLKELSVMQFDEGVRQLLDEMPGIHTLSVDHLAVEDHALEGVIRSGVRHFLLCADHGDAEKWTKLISPTFPPDQLKTLELRYIRFTHLKLLKDLLSRLPKLEQLKLEKIALEQSDEQGWTAFIQDLAARPDLALQWVDRGLAA